MTDHNRPHFEDEVILPQIVEKKRMSAFKKGIILTIAGAFVAAAVSGVAFPQGAVTLVNIILGGTPISGSNPLPVSGTFSASLSGFPTIQSTGTPIAVTTGGVTGTLPTGTVVVASNVGATNGAYCKLGASATVSDQLIPPNSWFAFTVGANTQLTCITSTSTTTVNMVGGSGLPTGSGGGGGAGGGGGTVTQGPTGTNAAAWWAQIGDTTNGPVAVATAGADAVSNSQNGLATYSRLELYNGTTWDRWKGTSGAANIAGTGVAGTPAGGVLSIQGVASGTVLPISGAVTNAGTFAVQLSGATNNINNIAGTISLPTGAATSVNQPTNAAQGSTTAAQTGTLIQGAVTTGSPTYTTAQTSPLSLDTSGNLRVNVVTGGGAGGTSSTFGAAFPGTGTAIGMTQGGNMIALSGTAGSLNVALAANQSVNVAQVNGVTTLTGTGAVGTGAQRIAVGTDTATIAGSAPGTAGTASTNVVSIQGIASMTPILANPGTAANWGVVAQGSTTSGESGQMAMGAVTTAAPTYTTTQTSPLSLDTAGNLRVNVVTGGGSGGTSSTFGSAFPSTGTAIGLTNGTNMVAWSATTNYGTAPAAIAVPAVNAFVTGAVGLAAGSTTSGQTGSLIMSATTAANPTYTTAQSNYVSSDVKGNTRVVLGGGIPITASATGTTTATTATLATSASVTTYICGFSIRANAAAAATNNATVTGVITGTMNFTQWTAPNASGLGVTEEIFTPCIPASAVNTSIAVVSGAPGTSGIVSVSAWGYQQ